ncbi:hypothetical protein WJX84_010311 [Apatococcus fuscideae]|uniref:Uncharacterized protein n=1 Tax=Apatococcus fuscideae TaxID=2026836 RepID=A0AAW1STD2_9CHLO
MIVAGIYTVLVASAWFIEGASRYSLGLYNSATDAASRHWQWQLFTGLYIIAHHDSCFISADHALRHHHLDSRGRLGLREVHQERPGQTRGGTAPRPTEGPAWGPIEELRLFGAFFLHLHFVLLVLPWALLRLFIFAVYVPHGLERSSLLVSPAMEAALAFTFLGTIFFRFGGGEVFGVGPAACADVAWPAVENVTILGHPRASIGNVELVTSSPSGLLGPADVTPDQVSWHPESGALMFTSLDLTIACPMSAQLRWEICEDGEQCLSPAPGSVMG